MNLTIKPRYLSSFTFWMDSSGGYVYLESDRHVGSLGTQICKRGNLCGPTLIATPDTFEKVCRNWLRARMSQKV
jgi:hypothetical protein